jgi:hypothetical protein
MNYESLTTHLAAAHLQAHTFHNPHGGSFVVTPHGARVLGLFSHEAGDNLYFVNPELTLPNTHKYLAGEHVLGGDRVWLAPERGLFFKGDRLEDGVVTQRSIDPGNWTIGALSPTSIRLVNEFTGTYFHEPGSTVRGIVERTIRVIPNPLAYTPEVMPSGVRFAGYEIRSSFELLESPKDALQFGLWFLIQLVVPSGGYLYAPTSGKTVITDYYEPTGADYLRVTENHVRFKLDSLDRHKIGIRKTEVTGRAGFLSNDQADGSEATLVIRNFLNDPSGNYADVPLHTPAGTQDSVQSYNHNTGPGGFGELEFHTPSVSRAMADARLTDTNQVWAFTGSRQDLVPIASKLLNLPVSVFAL